MNLKNILTLVYSCIFIFCLTACGQTVSDNITQESSISIADQINKDDAQSKAASYYPEGVQFCYTGQDSIYDEDNQQNFVEQPCHIFEVAYNDRIVSGAAVGIYDGSIWFKDMNADNLWLSKGFMGYTDEDSDMELSDPDREPFIELINGSNTLYFAHIRDISELSNQNEGTAIWAQESQSIVIKAVKVTGSVTGAPDGPAFHLEVKWIDDIPQVESIEYFPAPSYSRPSQVLLSGEMISIENDRLIEIAEYFRELINKQSS